MTDASDVLRRIPLFAEVLDEDQIERLAARCREVFFPAGTVMMTEGDFGASMFAIVDGDVSVTLSGRRDDYGVAALSPGDIVGEMSLMTGARRSATVTATSNVTALEITKVALEDVLARAPDLIESFGAVLARRQSELDRAAAHAAHGDDIVSQIRRFFTGRS